MRYSKPAAAILLASVILVVFETGIALAQDAPTPSAPAASADDRAPEGFFSIVFSGGLVGFTIIMLLFALSLTAAYLVFEHIMTIRRKEIMPEGLSEQVRQLLQAGRATDADRVCREQPCFLSFVLLNGLAEHDGGWPDIEKAMEDATAEQSARLFRKIEYLSVIGNIAPMVGLLGTVTGMILAFQQVANTGDAGAADLAEGIYQALVTTVGGLIVAIPSLGAFAIFRNRVDQFVAEAAYLAQHALSPLKRRTAKVTPSPASPPPPPPVEGGK
ncbi:MAG: MotA/TolQ/ExbB proton channel family protein [Planctomycetes bacterium]|nr:MotA/TolQ/ExbB proton channel family protein [Planctomycetota bacterium]